MSLQPTLFWSCGNIPLFVPQQTRTYQRELCTPTQVRISETTPNTDGVRDVDIPYTTPDADNAWWYSSNYPISADVAGGYITYMSGVTAPAPYERPVQDLAMVSCKGNSAAFTKGRAKPRVIAIEAIVIGKSCCAVKYWIDALTMSLRACCTNTSCGGSCAKVVYCGETWTLNNVALTEGPEVIYGAGSTDGCGCGCGSQTSIRFSLTATDPWLWSESSVVASHTFSVSPQIECPPFECVQYSDFDLSGDPTCAEAPVVPTPAVRTCFCPPPFQWRDCFEFTIPESIFRQTLQVDISTYGSTGPINGMVLNWWPKRFGKPAGDPYYDTIKPCGGIGVSYLEKSSSVSIGGLLARPMMSRAGLGGLDGSSRVYDIDNLPSSGCLDVSCGTFVACVGFNWFDAYQGGIENVEITVSRREARP